MNLPVRLTVAERLVQKLYAAATVLAVPFVWVYLGKRARKEPAYLSSRKERFAHYAIQTQPNKLALVWIHCVSVGETRAAAPLVHYFAQRFPGGVLLTYITPTGRATGEALFGQKVQHALLPWDTLDAMRRFFAHFTPQLCILMETEVWPNLLIQAQKASIPVLLANGRLNQKSLAKALRFHLLARPAYARLTLIMAQTALDAQRFHKAGAQNIKVLGNLKFDLTLDPVQLEQGREDRKKAAAAGLTTILLASTREGEELVLLKVLAPLLAQDPSIRLTVVPRRPQRFNEVAAHLGELSKQVVRRSTAGPNFAIASIALGDTMGEMAYYLGAADIVVIGGGWLPHGGSNPIEACAAGCAVIVGPHMFNFAEATALGVQAGAIRQLEGATQLVQTLYKLRNAPQILADCNACALNFATQHRGTLERSLAAIEPYLPVPSE
jgi:3-deoxy-D-manno-octulosonic-acid transferase